MEQVPRYFAFAITNCCQSHCVTCNGWTSPRDNIKNELSTNDWKFVLSSLKEWVGPFDFIFTGGEPFLRNDIFEIADYGASIGLIPKVITNGLALKNRCERLIDSGFKDITISLNAVKNPAIHNESRGLSYAFKITSDVIQNLSYLNRKKKADKKILIASVIMPSNLAEIVPLAEFAETNGIGINYQLLDGGTSFFDAYGIYEKSQEFYTKNKNIIIEAIEKLIELKKMGYTIYNTNKQLLAFKDLILNASISMNKKPKIHEMVSIQETSKDIKNTIIQDKIVIEKIQKVINRPYLKNSNLEMAQSTENCQIGNYNFLIDPYGSVRICFNFEPIGTMVTTMPQNIWTGIAANRIREKIKSCNQSCKLLNCNYHEGDD
ncbi:radical SAM protein [bacterium]|nr:radical SAM protein [bacterium]